MKLSSLILLLTIVAVSAGAEDHLVLVENNFFDPANLVIEQGDTVTWTNNSGGRHNVHADDNSFRCAESCSGPGSNPSSNVWTVTLQFDDPGLIRYYCDLHGAPGGIGMAGSIEVEESQTTIPAEDHVVILPIAGSVQGAAFFRTTARVMNLTDASLEVAAAYLPINQDNATVPPLVFTLGPREVVIFDDVVGTLFGASGLGAIRFHAEEPFTATSRIFTDSSCLDPPGGTFGQFVPGFAESAAMSAGVVPHLSWNQAFRANVGAMNPSSSNVTVTMSLHGPGGMIGAPEPVDLPPRGSIGPSSLVGLFEQPALDQANLWVSFVSDVPVIVYGSVVDNGTDDQIFVTPVAEPSSAAADKTGR